VACGAEARTLVTFYGCGYAVGVLIWLASLAVGTPTRYAVWGAARAVELSLPPLATRRLHRRTPTTVGHAAERWGLFTLVVLGESVVVVALGTAGAEWDGASVAAAVLSAVVVVSVWWLYFDRLESIALEAGDCCGRHVLLRSPSTAGRPRRDGRWAEPPHFVAAILVALVVGERVLLPPPRWAAS
jgi:low temperature requirement protein LtrA